MIPMTDALARALARVSRVVVAPAGLPDRPEYRDYAVGVRVAMTHLYADLPRLTRGGQRVLDVGPGTGAFLVCAEACDNTAWGEDRALDDATRAWPTHPELDAGLRTHVNAYARLTRQLGLNVRYHGFDRYLAAGRLPYTALDVVRFVHSLDAVLRPFRQDLPAAVARLVAMLRAALAPGGTLYIRHNGDDFRDEILPALRAARADFVVTRDTPRTTEWHRP